jgi:hypothetical protein
MTLGWQHYLVIVSAVISLAGGAAYIRDTVAGRTKPNRVTWALWAFAPLIGTGAAISSGAELWATVRIFLAGFVPLLVLVSSFVNPQSTWKITRFDWGCGLLSLAALVAWVMVDLPRVAIVLAAAGDGFAAIPTIIKSWRYPKTETGFNYLASLVSVLLVLPSITEWSIENYAFQVYLLIVNLVLVTLIYWPRRKN